MRHNFRHRLTTIALLACVALSWTISTGGAQSTAAPWRPPRFEAPNWVVARAVQAAKAFWGTSVFAHTEWGAGPLTRGIVPCRTEHVLADVPNGVQMVGYQSWLPLGSKHCVIGISTAYADSTWAAEHWTPLCLVIVHEYGHALGLLHSHDPTSVMWPYFDAPTLAVPYVCQNIANASGVPWPAAQSPDRTR